MAKTLLLADDSVTIQKVVGIAFASEDVDLVTVDNGDDAVAKAKELRPDAVLADVVMPGMNGYEVCEALKADPALQHVPVILLTGTFEAFDEERASRAGAVGHVAKPFEAQVLVERVNEILAEPPPAAPAPQPTPPTQPVATAASAAPADSFDFFDDDLGDLSPEQPSISQATTPPLGVAIKPEGSDGAFAFGDDDLAPPATQPTAPPQIRAPSPPPDSTVAIMPDDPSDSLESMPPGAPQPLPDSTMAIMPDEPAEQPPPLPQGPTQLDSALAVDASATDDLLSADLGAPANPPTPGGPAFDFEIADDSAEPEAGLVGTDDLAAATVLDPKGASGFDVSYSDLAAATPPLPAAPEPPPAASAPQAPPPLPVAEPQSPPAALAEPPQAAQPPVEAVPPPPVFEPAEVPEPPAAAELPPVLEPRFEEPQQLFGEAPPAEPPVAFNDFSDFEAPTPTPEMPSPAPEMPTPAPEPAAAALFGADEPDPVFPPDDDLGEPFPEAPHAPEVRMPASGTHDPSALAGMVLAEVTPRLREQLHDTLEKIAWESFGAVTEQVVRQAVERVEQIAWEVIPPMAETLIREEIRRMKGEGEDEA